MVTAGLMCPPLTCAIAQTMVATLRPKHSAIWMTGALLAHEPQATSTRSSVPRNSASSANQNLTDFTSCMLVVDIFSRFDQHETTTDLSTDNLFRKMLYNDHILKQLLPDETSHQHHLRRRRHNLCLTVKTDDRNFVTRQQNKRPLFRGRGRYRKVGVKHTPMARAGARAYNGGLGAEPQRGVQGQSPRWGGQGAKTPAADEVLCFNTVILNASATVFARNDVLFELLLL